MNGFQVPAVLTRCNSTVDGGLSLGVHTKELDPIEKVSIMEFHNKEGWLLFSPNPVADTDLPKEKAEVGAKTPSQRLRSVLFVLWEQSTPDTRGDFEQFYSNRMEALIKKVKEKLN